MSRAFRLEGKVNTTDTITVAEKAGLTWRKQPLQLNPAPQLVELLKRSQEIAAAESTEDDGD